MDYQNGMSAGVADRKDGLTERSFIGQSQSWVLGYLRGFHDTFAIYAG